MLVLIHVWLKSERSLFFNSVGWSFLLPDTHTHKECSHRDVTKGMVSRNTFCLLTRLGFFYCPFPETKLLK